MRRPATFLLLALGGVLSLVGLWVAAFTVDPAMGLDDRTLHGFRQLASPRTSPIADVIAHLADPAPFALISLGLAGIALGRRRPRHALAVGVILVAANATTQILKPALAQLRYSAYDGSAEGIAAAAWPSGHATASMSLALVAVLVASARWRPLVATLGAGFAVAVCYSLLSLGWHFPSDVLGGYLVAATWTAAAVAALVAAERRWPARTGREAVLALRTVLGPPALGVLGAGLAAVALFFGRPQRVLDFAALNTAFLLGAALIAVLGLGLAAGLALVLRPAPVRRRRRAPRTH